MSDISIMPSSITPLAPHRDHTVTPSGADAWFHCPRRATLVTKAETSPAMQRGSAIHDALRLDGRRDLAHRPRLSPEDIVLHGCSDTTLTDDPDFFAQATSCVAGARHFLEEYELTLVRAEQYVRSAYRDVGGAPGLRVRFSGRIDAVARTSGGELVLIDYKTGNSVPASPELAVLPSTFVYTYLGRCLRDQDPRIAASGAEIAVMQVLPHMGRFVRAKLSRDELLAGSSAIRAMMIDIDRGNYPPVPGEHCAYCPVKEDCPLRPQPAAWETEPF